MIKITVPATTANLGSGFDILGCAIKLYAHFYVEKTEVYRYENIDPAYACEDNLFIKAYQYGYNALQLPSHPIYLRFESDIPIARGLGSSASLIVGGLCAAYILNDRPLNKTELLRLAAHIEGHPDNVAPAIYGGLMSSYIKEDGSYQLIHHPIHPSLHFTFLIPNFELSTHMSRSVLPKVTPQEDVEHNANCLKKLLTGLETGSLPLILEGLDDRLHQPYRYPLIQEKSEVFKLLAAHGFIHTFLSGAGPTLGLIHTQAIPTQLIHQLNQLKGAWSVLTLAIDPQGVTLTHA